MNSPIVNKLPLLSPYRIHTRKLKAQKNKMRESIKVKEENVLFKPSKSLKKKLFDSSMIRRINEDNVKNLNAPSRKMNDLKTVSMPYLNEYQNKFQNLVSPTTKKNNGYSSDIKRFSSQEINEDSSTAVLKSVRSLEKINVNANSFSPKGIASIKSITAMQAVKEISLKNSKINHNSIKPLVSLMLRPSSTLKYLNLENTGISDKEVLLISETLINDRKLIFLGLAMNYLGENSAKFLKAMLSENHYLKKLDLHWNNLKDTGTLLIFQGLKSNQALKELDLS